MNTDVIQISQANFSIDNSPERLGERLSQARQAKGLSEATVAQKLRLSVAIIQALERDQYEKIPSAVFVRGYIRNYANLLGLDEPELSSSVEITSPPKLTLHPTSGAVTKNEIGSNNILVRMVTWIIVLSLISLVGLWWQGQLAWNDLEEPAVIPESVAEPTVNPTTAPVTSPDAESTPSQAPTPNRELTNGILAPALAMPAPTLPPSPKTQQAPTLMASSGTPTESHAESGTTGTQDPPANKVLLKFFDNCWVNVRDSKGGFKLTGVMRKGEKHILEGTPPYTVILGDSAAVKMTIAGKPFDIQDYSRGGVARFTLDPTTANQ